MSDIVLQANTESPLLSSLQRLAKTDLSYVTHKNYPNLSKAKVIINPNPAGAISGTDLSNTVQTFTLPSWGIMTDLVIISQLTCTGNNNPAISGDGNRVVQSQGARGLFSSVQLLSNNRVICQTTDGLYRVRAESSSLPTGLRLKYMSKYFSTDSNTVATTWSNSSVVTYLPFYCSFFDSIEQYLDLSFVQQLQVQLTYNTYANMGLVAPITGATTTIAMYFYNLQTDDLVRLRAQNFNPNEQYIALGWNVYQESTALTSSLTTYTYNVQCQYPAYATHIYLKDTTYDVLYPITNVTVNMGGKVIYSAIPQVPMSQESDLNGGSGLIQFDQVLTTGLTGGSAALPVCFMGNKSTRPVSIYWGLEPGKRMYNSGAVSLHNVPNFQITVTMASTNSTTAMYVVTEYYTMVSVNSSDGAVTVSLSS